MHIKRSFLWRFGHLVDRRKAADSERWLVTSTYLAYFCIFFRSIASTGVLVRTTYLHTLITTMEFCMLASLVLSADRSA